MRFFVGNLFKKLRNLTDRVAFLNAYDVEERFFLFIEEHYGLKPEVQVDLSKAELAEAIGTIPETISRMIARLKTRGVVNWERNELKINVEYAKSVIEKLKPE
jgi:CRP/FNR family transcriptional regulator